MIEIDAKLLREALDGLGITVPIYHARKLRGGSVEVITRDGRQVWKPPEKETASDPTLSGAESTVADSAPVPGSGTGVRCVSKPRASRKRATSAEGE